MERRSGLQDGVEILGSFGICLCNIYVYAKRWEHSSKEKFLTS